MSELMRNKHNIPDHYVKDTKLTNWMRKHLGMKELEGIYINDIDQRSTLNKQGCYLYDSRVVLAFPKHSVKMTISESINLFKGA